MTNVFVSNCKMYLSQMHCWLPPSIQVIIVLTQLEGSGGFSIAHRWNSSLKTAAQNNWQTIWETFLGNFFGTDETSSLIIAAQNNLQIVLRLVSWSLIILKHFHQPHQLTPKSRLSANHAISLVFYPNKMSIKQQLFVRNGQNGQITLIISRLTHRVALQPGLHDWAPPGSWNIINLYI